MERISTLLRIASLITGRGLLNHRVYFYSPSVSLANQRAAPPRGTRFPVARLHSSNCIATSPPFKKRHLSARLDCLLNYGAQEEKGSVISVIMDLDISVVRRLSSPPRPWGTSLTPDSWEPGWAAAKAAEHSSLSLLPSHRQGVVKGSVWPHANVSCATGPIGTVI